MLPADLVPEAPQEQYSTRTISLEEAFARQNDRIGYLRSMGLPWAEAVYQLRDLLVGREDQEFWDGIPKEVRIKLGGMSEAEKDRVRTRWSVEGWLGYPCRAIPGPLGPDGQPVPIYRPTPDDLSHAYQIIMRLAARLQLTWRTKRVSEMPGPAESKGVDTS